MLICWNDIKIHLGIEDSYFVPPPIDKFTIYLWATLTIPSEAKDVLPIN